MLSGKCIVIIGGTSGIGLSAAKAFINLGARVLSVGPDAEGCRRAEELLGPAARIVKGDAREEYTAEEAVKQCVEAFGDVDALYHVAGGSGRKWGDGPLHECTLEGWNKTLELNLSSVMLSNRAVIRYWRQMGRGGAILNLGSVLGFSPSPGFFYTHAYAASKSAIIGFSKSIAAYYAPDNIRVNVLAPALTNTPMARRAMEDSDIVTFGSRKQPLDGGRIGTPADLDGAAVYLISDQARFVTAQVLAVDGGWSVSEGIER